MTEYLGGGPSRRCRCELSDRGLEFSSLMRRGYMCYRRQQEVDSERRPALCKIHLLVSERTV